MQTRVSCSASKLSQLEPPMIRSTVTASEFQIGNQYFHESRVTIFRADEFYIISKVEGNSGTYIQAMRLKERSLDAKCSCPLTAGLLCRHLVAALLEYNRWRHLCNPNNSQERPVMNDPIIEQHGTTSGLDITLRDVTFSSIGCTRPLRRGNAGKDYRRCPTLCLER